MIGVYKHADRETLRLLSNILKKVLNPTFYIPALERSPYFLIETNLESAEYASSSLELVVNGVGTKNSDDTLTGVISFSGYYDPIGPNIYGLNLGSSFITYLGINYDGEYIKLIVGTESASSLSCELFLTGTGDNRNHCTNVTSYTDEFDPEDWTGTDVFEGEADVNFAFRILTNDTEQVTIDQNVTSETLIGSIRHSSEAERLARPITIKFAGDVSGSPISIQNSNQVETATLSISDEKVLEIANTVINEVAGEFPIATTEQVGGFLVASDTLADGLYPIAVDQDTAVGYVDLSDLKQELRDEGLADIHRYDDLSTVPNPSIGFIVQYIGPTTGLYTNGFFYQYWPTSFNTNIDGERWMLTTTSADASLAIREFTKTINYRIRPNVPITITLLPNEESGSDSDEEEVIPFTNDTLFKVKQQYYNIILTLAEINSNFGISLKPAYSTSYNVGEESLYTVTVNWNSVDSAGGEWVLKNVQPLLEMASAVSYKGTRLWADLEALTPSAQLGDFYTISDRSNQEWFFNGIITDNWEDSWEYMGEVVKTYTGSDNINITSDGIISAKGYVYNNIKQSIATGISTQATGYYSHAEGFNTNAINNGAHAEGYETEASGQYGAHAEGGYSKATGHNSHAEGWNTESAMNASHAEGLHTTALGPRSHAEGMSGSGSGTSAKTVIPSLSTSTSNGDIITAWGTTKFTLAKGENSHAEGESTLALGDNSHAEGYETNAKNQNSHAEGKWTTTLGEQAHAEGDLTTALGNNSHTEGGSSYKATDKVSSLDTAPDTAIKTAWKSTKFTLAKGSSSHAEGTNTLALGISSHAEGNNTIAEGANSHASGNGTIADSNNMTAIGRYNSGNDSPNLGDYLFQIGNGTGAAAADRSNAFAVLDNGIAQVLRNVIGKIIPQDYESTNHNALTLNYKSEKYNFLRADGNCTITVNIGAGAAANDAVKCASDIIVHVENTTGSTITLSVVEGSGGYVGTLINMWDANLTNGTGLTLAAGQHAELCFTFWYRSHVSFNGGLSVSVS